MELKEIVDRICDGLVFVDNNTQIQNSANSDYGNYLKGVGCLGEHQFRDEIVSWWNNKIKYIRCRCSSYCRNHIESIKCNGVRSL